MARSWSHLTYPQPNQRKTLIMNKTRILLASILLAASSAASAEFYSGQQLLNLLQSKSSPDRILALGYVAGVHDLGENILWCDVPQDVTNGQLAAVVGVYLRNLSRSERQKGAGSLVTHALLDYLTPCPKNSDSL